MLIILYKDEYDQLCEERISVSPNEKTTVVENILTRGLSLEFSKDIIPPHRILRIRQ